MIKANTSLTIQKESNWIRARCTGVSTDGKVVTMKEESGEIFTTNQEGRAVKTGAFMRSLFI